MGLTSAEAASVGPVSTRQISARRTSARWSSPESGRRHLIASNQQADESRFVKRGENDGSGAAKRGQRADDCPHASRSSVARGFCPSRDPGQPFDRLPATAPCAHSWKSCFPGWQAWAPCQTANGRADMAGKLLPYVTWHSKPCGADGLPGAVRHPNQYRLSEPGPCSPRSGKAHPRGGEKNSRHSHRLNPSGKRAQEDCSWLRLLRRLACSLPWRPLCLRVLLVAIRAWRIFLLGLVICWCERCSFSGRSDWITPGICAATRVMGWACSRTDPGPTDTFTPNASSHRSRRLTDQKPSQMGSHSGQRACGSYQSLPRKRWSLSTTSMGTASPSTLTR